MAVRSAEARWEGSLKEGSGNLKLGSGAFEGAYSFSSRFEDGTGTNPEELIGAAHAGCYSMALNNDLHGAGYTPTYVNTVANVHYGRADADSPLAINKIELTVEASIPGIDEETFLKMAEATKENCIISRALNVAEMNVTATLISE